MSTEAPKKDERIFEAEFVLDTQFDLPPVSAPKKKYLILSTPRSGSTMLASALYNSKLAGAPFEYFHHNVLRAVGNPEQYPNKLNSYFYDLVARRTSENGIFGMKLHFSQFERLFCAAPDLINYGVAFLHEFQKFILIYRRDKILQAISLMLSKESRIWATNASKYKNQLGRSYQTIDTIVISDYIKQLTFQEYSWRKLIENLKLPHIEVAYEDLQANSTQEFDRALKFLDADFGPQSSTQEMTVKTSNVSLTQAIKRKYLKSIGADLSNA